MCDKDKNQIDQKLLPSCNGSKKLHRQYRITSSSCQLQVGSEVYSDRQFQIYASVSLTKRPVHHIFKGRAEDRIGAWGFYSAQPT